MRLYAADPPAGTIHSLRRYDVSDLDPLSWAAIASDCAAALGSAGADAAGLLIPAARSDEHLLLLVADQIGVEAVQVPPGREPDGLGPCGEASHDYEDLFSDALMAGLSRQPCPDCGVQVGACHAAHCDVARCSHCRGQHLLCGCEALADAWAGEWPGVYEARVLGLYARRTEQGWIPCLPDAPGGREDLNRLAEYWARRGTDSHRRR